MKCYIHTERDAVGVCSICGRGVCSECAVTVHGKIYCKADVENITIKKSGEKSAAIMIASILLFIFGILGCLGSIVVLAFGGVLSTIPFIGGYLGGFLYLLGGATLIFSILELLAGYWLWNSLRKGGILAIIILVLDMITSLLFIMVPGGVFIGGISLVFDLLILVLVAVGWNSLT